MVDISNDLARLKMVELLARRTGQTLCENRLWRIDTALKPLLVKYKLASLGELATMMDKAAGDSLQSEITDALLNNESFFFRDHLLFTYINNVLLEDIRTAKGANRTLSIWLAGCSNGQEAYSVAMMLAEDPARWAGWSIRIVATDVSEGAIERARKGIYSQFEIQRGLPVTRMVRWFDQDGENWVAREELRRMIDFRQQNMLLQTPLGGPFDLIFCRNVLLYFSLPVRRQVFARLRKLIAPHGYLMLGAGETVIGQTDDFASSRVHRGFYCPTAESNEIALRSA